MYKCSVALQLILIKLICEKLCHGLSEWVFLKFQWWPIVAKQSVKLNKFNVKIDEWKNTKQDSESIFFSS